MKANSGSVAVQGPGRGCCRFNDACLCGVCVCVGCGRIDGIMDMLARGYAASLTWVGRRGLSARLVVIRESVCFAASPAPTWSPCVLGTGCSMYDYTMAHQRSGCGTVKGERRLWLAQELWALAGQDTHGVVPYRHRQRFRSWVFCLCCL